MDSSDKAAGGQKPSAKKQVDVESIEDQAKDILKNTEVPDIDRIEISEDMKSRLKTAGALELDVIEKELGLGNDEQFLQDQQAVEGDEIQRVYADEESDSGKGGDQADIDTETAEASVDGECDITVSEDKMSAVIDLSPSQGGGKPLTFDIVNRELKSQAVVYGVNYELLKKLIQNVEKTKNEKNGVIIAQGTLPEEGEDGNIEFHISEDESILEEEENRKGERLVE